jgi:hypothetical protein
VIEVGVPKVRVDLEPGAALPRVAAVEQRLNRGEQDRSPCLLTADKGRRASGNDIGELEKAAIALNPR